MKRRGLTKRGGNAKDQPKKKAKQTIGDDAFDWSAAGGQDVIASDSEADDKDGNATSDEEDDEEIQETADEKRLRLAKEYLGKIAEQEEGDDDDGVDRVGARLHQDALEASGKLFKTIADQFQDFEFDSDSIRFLRGHRLPVTCVCLMEDGRTAFSAAKDGSLLRWDLAQQTKTKLKLPEDDVAETKSDHDRAILSVAVSSDGKFLATGGHDKLVRVWNPETNELMESFSGHRDTISAVCFRLRSHSLFTGSFDRSIKHWNLTEMGYVETLFGHQSEVNGLDALYRERVTSCGRDRSVRMWKIPEETQLVFYGNSGSMDCVKMVSEEYHVTGGDDGSLSLWFNGRKKPVSVIHNAHGGKWISSAAVMPRTDLVASGSADGVIRLWKADLSARTLEPVATVPLVGSVNGLCFDNKGRFLLAAVSQEHRLGRWDRIKEAKNGLALIALPNVDEEN
ncbi:TPA: hypothetical protein N0F65_004088 [Lagenidium giganteum]|uniref:WD repeat-containing protein 75 second beta-propeller domain-containing protein n=1 Tax=Lagenidium giganteum TaxID=4803 RepID=A0AAV2YWW8_9STRA|nr:TPA: hypothetical protein N0F65_004088 [Lagenidium giganteum]